MSSRSVLGTFDLDSFQQGPFPWILSAFVAVVLGLTCPAFAFILRGSHGDLSLMLVTAGCELSYGFLGCLMIGQLHRSGLLDERYKEALTPLCISGLTVIAMPVSVLFLCWHNVAIFLFVSVILYY